jgi:biopolymer transport protein ExbD
MKVKQSHSMPSAETDMTPMIDMTFQLITFFMFVMKVSDIEADARIKLPSSQIAKPPEGKPGQIYVLQITSNNKVLHNGQDIDLNRFDKLLRIEVDTMRRLDKDPKETTVLVRADSFAEAGQVQKVIQICQKYGLVKFSFRALSKSEN